MTHHTTTMYNSYFTRATNTTVLPPNYTNQTVLDWCNRKYDSAVFYDQTRKINIFTTIIIIIIGILGNILAVFVFAQKRFRLKSPGVFLLCLAISDGLFLLTHFFEDTLRTYIDVYIDNSAKQLIPDPNCAIFGPRSGDIELNDNGSESYLKILNITDNFNLTCRLVNYFRYFLRFVSAYIITIFTIQRAVVIFYPLYQSKFSSTRMAWLIMLILNISAALLCIFVPFLFQLNTSDVKSKLYCDTDRSNETIKHVYFVTTIIYIVLIMFVPIVTIILCNTLIIFQLCRASKNRRELCNISEIPTKHNISRQNSNNKSFNLYLSSGNNKYTASYLTRQSSTQSARTYTPMLASKGIVKLQNESFKVTRMLIIMSLSYAILNLPYFVAWCTFYYKIGITKDITYTSGNYLFGWLNIAEIFYVLNYGVHFFLYCASGQRFRAQLKYSF